jgi:hypothetical protein
MTTSELEGVRPLVCQWTASSDGSSGAETTARPVADTIPEVRQLAALPPQSARSHQAPGAVFFSCKLSRVFPIPTGPVRVTSRTSSRRNSAQTASAASNPGLPRSWLQGGRTANEKDDTSGIAAPQQSRICGQYRLQYGLLLAFKSHALPYCYPGPGVHSATGKASTLSGAGAYRLLVRLALSGDLIASQTYATKLLWMVLVSLGHAQLQSSLRSLSPCVVSSGKVTFDGA